MSELDTRVTNVIKKSTLFSTIQSLIEEDFINDVSSNIEHILSTSNGSFDDKQDDISDFILDYLENKNIEIDSNEADAFANILVWIYEEYKVHEDAMYNRIMKIKSPDVSVQDMSDEDSESVEH